MLEMKDTFHKIWQCSQTTAPGHEDSSVVGEGQLCESRSSPLKCVRSHVFSRAYLPKHTPLTFCENYSHRQPACSSSFVHSCLGAILWYLWQLFDPARTSGVIRSWSPFCWIFPTELFFHKLFFHKVFFPLLSSSNILFTTGDTKMNGA